MAEPGWFGLAGPPPRPTGRPACNEIRPGLLVGEYPLPDDVAWLRDVHRVTAVVSLQEDADLAAKGVSLVQLERAYAAHGIAFHRIPVVDGDPQHLADRLENIVPLLAGLRDAGACVYLHCNAGFNRAPTAAIAYLAAHEGLGLEAARALVKERRHCVPYMRSLELFFARRA
jgi:atypical dual specificity phosphatase